MHTYHDLSDFKAFGSVVKELFAKDIGHRFSCSKCFIIYLTNADKVMQHVTILHR